MDQKELEQVTSIIEQAKQQATQSQTQVMQQQVNEAIEDKSMLKEQLDLGEDLTRIDYLLRGYQLIVQEDGSTKWEEPVNKDLVVLSDYGVQMIRDSIAWYINKNTLLSNYDEETILEKMEDFASDLNDDIYMSYEKAFQYPTLDECKAELKERIKKKVDIRMFAKELLGQVADKKDIENAILKEMEDTIERELEVIKAQKMKSKLKRFPMIMRKVQDAVHSTYLRAYKGAERTSLRKHMNVSETRGATVIQPEKRSMMPWRTR